MLSLLGDKVERGRMPFLGRLTSRQDQTESRFWGAIIDRVLRRPAVSAGVAAGALLAVLAIPAFSIKTQTPSFKFLPQDLAIVKTYKQIEQKFPGGPGPRGDRVPGERRHLARGQVGDRRVQEAGPRHRSRSETRSR